jgi:enterochelin esterase-like enzyme
MIVVFPDIYVSATQDKCSALDDKNNAAYDNFINLLTKEIMPFMEQNYSIKTGRENTAITGFSMGGRESLYIGFTRPDLFGISGRCVRHRAFRCRTVSLRSGRVRSRTCFM